MDDSGHPHPERPVVEYEYEDPAYRVFIDQTTPFMVGKPTTLKMEILDQFGKKYQITFE